MSFELALIYQLHRNFSRQPSYSWRTWPEPKSRDFLTLGQWNGPLFGLHGRPRVDFRRGHQSDCGWRTTIVGGQAIICWLLDRAGGHLRTLICWSAGVCIDPECSPFRLQYSSWMQPQSGRQLSVQPRVRRPIHTVGALSLSQLIMIIQRSSL